MRRGDWTWLEIAKLVLAAATPLAVLYFSLTAESALRDRDAVARRQDAAQELSRAVYSRAARSALLISALERHAAAPTPRSLTEIADRKNDYDQSYRDWNEAIMANLLTVRRIIDVETFHMLEGIVEYHLVTDGFAVLDACLTAAYDGALRDKDPRPILAECKATRLLRFAYDCGYAFVDAIFQIASDRLAEQAQHQLVFSYVAPVCGAPAVGGRFLGYGPRLR